MDAQLRLALQRDVVDSQDVAMHGDVGAHEGASLAPAGIRLPRDVANAHLGRRASVVLRADVDAHPVDPGTAHTLLHGLDASMRVAISSRMRLGCTCCRDEDRQRR